MITFVRRLGGKYILADASYRFQESWLGFCFHYHCAVHPAYNKWPHYHGFEVVFVSLYIILSHFDHYADCSGSIEHIKYLPGILCQMCELPFMPFMGQRQLTNFFFDDCENVCISSYFHHEI